MLLTEYHLEFLSLTGGYTGSSESTFVKMPHCWKSHVAALMIMQFVPIDTIVLVEKNSRYSQTDQLCNR